MSGGDETGHHQVQRLGGEQGIGEAKIERRIGAGGRWGQHGPAVAPAPFGHDAPEQRSTLVDRLDRRKGHWLEGH